MDVAAWIDAAAACSQLDVELFIVVTQQVQTTAKPFNRTHEEKKKSIKHITIR